MRISENQTQRAARRSLPPLSVFYWPNICLPVCRHKHYLSDLEGSVLLAFYSTEPTERMIWGSIPALNWDIFASICNLQDPSPFRCKLRRSGLVGCVVEALRAAINCLILTIVDL